MISLASNNALSLGPIIVIAVVGIAAVLLLARWCRHALMARIHWSILLLRTAVLIGVLLALANPWFASEEKDPDAYRVVVLADTSASMTSRDLPGTSTRLDWIDQWLSSDNPDGLAALQSTQPAAEVFLFSDTIRPWDLQALTSPMRGNSGIGAALQEIAQSDPSGGTRPLGAVLLLSDGANIAGTPAIDSARILAANGVPVSVIGIGESTSTGSLQVSIKKPRLALEFQAEDQISAELSNSLSRDVRGELRLFRGNQLMDSRELTLAAGSVTEESFRVRGETPGTATYRVEWDSPEARLQSQLSSAFAIVETSPPPVFRLLLIADAAGWESRAWRLLANSSDTLIMDSLIRVDDERYLKRLFPRDHGLDANGQRAPETREMVESLPADAAFYMDYDGIIIDATAAHEQADNIGATLAEFAGQRGGGLLLIVAESNSSALQLPDPLRELFALRDAELVTTANVTPLAVEPFPLFADQSGGALFSSPEPALPRGAVIAQEGRLSRAAQTPLFTRNGRLPILAIQAYGAGRTAVLGAEFLWRWQLADEQSATQFRELGTGLLSWLTAGRKQRLTTPLNGRVLPFDAPVPLDVQLLGDDFSPRMDANVSASLTAPDGTVTRHRLQPVLEEPGRYQLPLEIDSPGAYTASYSAVMDDGTELTTEAWFAVENRSDELTRAGYNEQLLRDIARLTGGRFTDYADADDSSELPIAAAIPTLQERVHWARSWPFLAILAILMVLEWWLRRRHGLR